MYCTVLRIIALSSMMATHHPTHIVPVHHSMLIPPLPVGECDEENKDGGQGKELHIGPTQGI